MTNKEPVVLETVSEERLRELLSRVSPPAEGWRVGLPTVEVHSIISELLASRLAIQAPDNRSPAERDAAMGMASEAYVQDRTPVLVLQKPGAIDGTSEGFYDPAQLRAAFRHGYDYARKPHTPLPAAPNLGATK